MVAFKNYIASMTPLSEASWAMLQECSTELRLSRKDFLLREGQRCTAVFFISSGLCRSSFNQDGKEINTAFYFEQEFATNIKSLTTAAPSGYFIQALEPATVIRLEKDRLLAAYQQSHEIETFGRKVLETLSARQEELTDRFRLLTPKQRLEQLLQDRPDFLQRVSLTLTASYLGISRETLTRLRNAR